MAGRSSRFAKAHRSRRSLGTRSGGGGTGYVTLAARYGILEPQPGPYGGHSARWWQQKFRSYSQYRKLYEDIRSGALNLAGSRFQELREKAAFLLPAVDTKINDLEIRASQAGVPRTLRE